mgnify:CR=1 FL=1
MNDYYDEDDTSQGKRDGSDTSQGSENYEKEQGIPDYIEGSKEYSRSESLNLIKSIESSKIHGGVQLKFNN